MAQQSLPPLDSSVDRAVRAAHGREHVERPAGIKGGFKTTGGTSTMGTVGGGASPATESAPAADGPPAWAQRMRRGQALSHGVTAAAHAVRSGDSHGGGSSISLSESDRT